MARLYCIDCHDLSFDCDFVAQGSSLTEAIELFAEHGRAIHALRSLGPALYIRIRTCMRVIEAGLPDQREPTTTGLA